MLKWPLLIGSLVPEISLGMHLDGPSGIREVGGAKLNRAPVRNVRTWPAMPGKAQAAYNREAESTYAPERGGLPCSSDEAG